MQVCPMVDFPFFGGPFGSPNLDQYLKLGQPPKKRHKCDNWTNELEWPLSGIRHWMVIDPLIGGAQYKQKQQQCPRLYGDTIILHDSINYNIFMSTGSVGWTRQSFLWGTAEVKRSLCIAFNTDSEYVDAGELCLRHESAYGYGCPCKSLGTFLTPPRWPK